MTAGQTSGTGGKTPPAVEPSAAPRQHLGLLTQVMTDTLDADYELVSARRREEGMPRAGIPGRGIVVVLVIFGVMLGVSALRTAQGRPAAAQQRADLVAQIHGRQAHLNRLNNALAARQRDVAVLQNRLSKEATSSTAMARHLRVLGLNAATTAVTGPGIEITADNAPNATRISGGVILDTDLQGLVNGLWQAGAQAIAINGYRLGPLTSIRTAGEAITVNYRSLTPPYVVDVLGNPDTLPARFAETPAGQTWLGLRSNFGIRFTSRPAATLALPADPHDHLLYAKAKGS